MIKKFFTMLAVVFLVGILIIKLVSVANRVSDINLENTQLKQQIETTKQCLRNSMYEEWELCYE